MVGVFALFNDLRIDHHRALRQCPLVSFLDWRALDHLADFAGKYLHRERLGDNLHTGIKERASRRIFGVTRHEKDLQGWTLDARGVRELATIQPRQADIAHEKVDALRRLQDPQCGRAIGCFKRLIAQIVEDLDNEKTDDSFVLYDQNDFVGRGAMVVPNPCSAARIEQSPL